MTINETREKNLATTVRPHLNLLEAVCGEKAAFSKKFERLLDKGRGLTNNAAGLQSDDIEVGIIRLIVVAGRFWGLGKARRAAEASIELRDADWASLEGALRSSFLWIWALRNNLASQFEGYMLTFFRLNEERQKARGNFEDLRGCDDDAEHFHCPIEAIITEPFRAVV